MFNVYVGNLLMMRVYEDDTIEYVEPPAPPEPPSDYSYSSTVTVIIPQIYNATATIPTNMYNYSSEVSVSAN